MRLPSTPSAALVNQLNTTYFDQLWNATDDHGRKNFQLSQVGQRLQVGSVSVNQSVVGLPTTDTVYAVYQVPYGNFGRFVNMSTNTWITDSDLLTNVGISLDTYTAAGRVCPTGTVNLYYDPVYSTVLIAIAYQYVTKCAGNIQPQLYMTVYKDTTRQTPIITQLFTVSTTALSTTTPAIVNNAISAANTTYPNGTIVSVNGFVYTSSTVPTLVDKDVVEIICDPDIVGHCDITVDDSVTGYYSNKFSEYREVLHIPKSLNPDNVILTEDVVDVVVINPANNQGVYGHRVDSHAVMSITHNDFSMSRSVIGSFQNDLQAQSVIVRVYVRYPTRPIYLTDDVNHISDLYSLQDSAIQKQLTSQSTTQIAEWSAANLEQSAFLPLLYNFNGFDSASILNTFVSAMGYYDVASVLSQCMRYYTYANAQVEVFKPSRLSSVVCDAIVYSNGRKIPKAALNISDYTSCSFLLGFTSNGYVINGSRIALYIVESDPRTPVAFSPTSANPSISLPNEDFALYQIIHYSNPVEVWNGTTSAGYELISQNPAAYTTTANPDGTYTYTASFGLLNKDFYLIPKYGMTTIQYSLDTFLSNKQPIIIPIQTTDSNGALVPLVGYTTLEIYINGYRLIEGMDYTINSAPGNNNDVLQTLLVVSNADYLDFANLGNYLEVVVHGDAVVSQDKGYTISNMMYRTSNPNVWSRSCGRTFAHGVLIENVTESGNVVTSSTSVADGAPFLIEWCIPFGVSKLLSGFTFTQDYSLKARIDRVLGIQTPTWPSTVLISHLYALYSPYLSQIIYDVVNGNFTIVNDPKDDSFLSQFAKYNIIRTGDPTLGTANQLIDRRFVTLAADYANFSVADPTQMMLIQRLVNLLLTPALLSMNEVLV